MRRRLRHHLLAVLGLAVVAVGVVGGEASALTCAPHPDGSPAAIASGTEQLAGTGHFFDVYDAAVIGTVTAIHTDEQAGSPTYGATRIEVVVAGVLGAGSAPASMTLSAPDPGWLAGFPFAVGQSYFVPIMETGPAGQRNWTFGCDPISVVGDPRASVTALQPLAEAAGYSLSVAGTPAPPPEPDAADPDPPGPAEPTGPDADGIGWLEPVAGGAAVAAAGLTAWLLLRRRPAGLA